MERRQSEEGADERKMMYLFKICPVSKPRQTRADVWKKRPVVIAYRAFADELRYLAKAKKFKLPEKFEVTFFLPLAKKTRHLSGEWHRQRPDLDNLLKALQDALLPEDSSICCVKMSKRWATEGSIVIEIEDL